MTPDEVAQRVAPTSRIVYVDNDPVVLLHAQALLRSDPRGCCTYIQADARDTEKILAEAKATLDFSQPVAVMALGLLHFIPDADDPYALVRRLMDPFVPGSHLRDLARDLGRPHRPAASGRTATTRLRRRDHHALARAGDVVLRGPRPRRAGAHPAGQWSAPGANPVNLPGTRVWAAEP